jgi:NAD(P)-dependent dehydrogenase (short-subunit alcohol dehydrogenase family)
MKAPKRGPIPPIRAGLKAVVDYYREGLPLGSLTEADRLDGKTCLITGASSGLGRALAVELGRRGGRLLLACRASHVGLAEQIQRESGNREIGQRVLDLADLSSVLALCDELARDRIRLDLVVSNAGVAPARNRLTRDGFAELFQVNFLGSFVLLNRLLADGTLPNATLGGTDDVRRAIPRVLVTSSETHRQAPPIDYARFGHFPDFSLLSGTTWYGHSKLYVQTFACELGRRLARSGRPDVSVFSYCPGALRSNISREAGLAGKLMTSFFIDPRKAVWPAVYCAVSPALEGRSERYLYLRHLAEPDRLAADPSNGARLWQRSLELLSTRGIVLPTLPPAQP